VIGRQHLSLLNFGHSFRYVASQKAQVEVATVHADA
jgi:hypothetical protein